MGEQRDHYAILGVSPQADERAIRLAFRRLARIYHPDVADTGNLARMLQVNEAYRVLSDPERRRLYDLQRGEPSARVPRDPAAASAATATGSPAPPHATAAPTAARGVVQHSPGPLRQLARLAAADPTPLAAASLARGGAVLVAGLLDGRVRLWDVASARATQTLSFAPAAAGVLHAVRLSPAGTLAAAWGLELGTRVWHIADGQALWTSGANAPSGAMDLVLSDDPALARLALPDAPLALAGDDAFRWAHEGRAGTAIFTRPLTGPVDPAWAVPRHCVEGRASAGGSGSVNSSWRVYERVLSADGTRLLTFSAQPSPGTVRTMALHIWELDGRAPINGGVPRRVARVVLAPGAAWYPIAATPDLSWVAVGYQEQTMRLLAPAAQTQRTLSTGLVPNEALVALSADAALLALARGRALDLWAVSDGRHLQRWECAADITTLTFATRAAQTGWPALAIGLANGVAEVWG